MTITRYTIKRLEKELRESGERDYLVIPIMATEKEAKAIRRQAKRQGKTTRGIPLHDYTKHKKGLK